MLLDTDKTNEIASGSSVSWTEVTSPVAPAQTPFCTDVEYQTTEGGSDPVYGEVAWRTLISGDRTPSNGLVLGIADFPAFGTLRAHRHEPPEFYLGLSGDGTVTIDGETFVISKGIAVFIPGNAEHQVDAGAAGLSFAYGFAKNEFPEIKYEFSAAVSA